MDLGKLKRNVRPTMGIENIHPKPHQQLKGPHAPKSELQDCTNHNELSVVTDDLNKTAVNIEEVVCSRC